MCPEMTTRTEERQLPPTVTMASNLFFLFFKFVKKVTLICQVPDHTVLESRFLTRMHHRAQALNHVNVPPPTPLARQIIFKTRATAR